METALVLELSGSCPKDVKEKITIFLSRFLFWSIESPIP